MEVQDDDSCHQGDLNDTPRILQSTLRQHNLRPRKSKDTDADASSSQPTPRAKTQAEHMREYRLKIKLDKEKYGLYRTAETVRINEYRKNQPEEAIVRNRELQRLRQANYCQRKKRESVVMTTPKTRKGTEMEERKKEEPREKNRLRKQAYRAEMSSQKKVSLNAQRRQKYAKKNPKRNC